MQLYCIIFSFALCCFPFFIECSQRNRASNKTKTSTAIQSKKRKREPEMTALEQEDYFAARRAFFKSVDEHQLSYVWDKENPRAELKKKRAQPMATLNYVPLQDNSLLLNQDNSLLLNNDSDPKQPKKKVKRRPFNQQNAFNQYNQCKVLPQIIYPSSKPPKNEDLGYGHFTNLKVINGKVVNLNEEESLFVRDMYVYPHRPFCAYKPIKKPGKAECELSEIAAINLNFNETTDLSDSSNDDSYSKTFDSNPNSD